MVIYIDDRIGIVNGDTSKYLHFTIIVGINFWFYFEIKNECSHMSCFDIQRIYESEQCNKIRDIKILLYNNYSPNKNFKAYNVKTL